MKIPLVLLRKADEVVEARVNAICTPRGCHAGMMFVSFVVDTGSSKSFISFNDARHYNLPLGSFKQVDQFYMAGGAYCLTQFPDTVRVTFNDETGSGIAPFTLKEFHAIRPVSDSPSAIAKSERVPSIIGLDFIEKNKLTLVIDGGARRAFLERND